MRYKLIPPVPGGYGWWDVQDTDRNVTIASFSALYMPTSEHEARTLCNKLNNQ